MIRLRKTASFLVGIMIIINLTACAPEDPNAVIDKPTQETDQTAAPTDTEHNSVEQSSIEALLLETPSHINKVFSEDFSVEADVHVPKVKKADILFAKSMPLDEQKLLSIFYKGKTPQRSLDSNDDTILYKDDNSYLNINDGFLVYGKQEYEYVKFPTDSLVSASDIVSTGSQFSDVYKQENLGFMTKSEAFDNVSDVLAELTIDIAEDAEIYAIDSSTMQTQQDERIKKDIDMQKEMGFTTIHDSTEGYQTKDAFTQDDDFYIFFFKMTQNEIPVTQKSYIIQANDRSLNGSTARVSYSRNGIIQLAFNGIYQQQGVAESPDTLISVEEALQKAFEKHNAIISTDKVTVSAVDFEYVPVPYNDNYDEVKLTPTWSLTLEYERDTTDKPSKDGKKGSKSRVSHRIIFINAVTGEEIQ